MVDIIKRVISEINKDLIPDIDMNIHRINSGGCGAFACMLIDRLTILGITAIARELVVPVGTYFAGDGCAPNGIPIVGYVKNNFGSFEKYAEKVIENHGSNFPEVSNPDYVAWTHIVTEVKDLNKIFIIDAETVGSIRNDNNGFVLGDSIMGKTVLGNVIPLDILREISLSKMADEGHLWNPAFNRKQLPTVKQLLEKDLI